MKLFPDLEDPLEWGGGGEGEVLRKAVGNLVVELLKCERTAHGKKWLRQIPAL